MPSPSPPTRCLSVAIRRPSLRSHSTTEPIQFDTTLCLSLLRPFYSRRCVSVAGIEPCLAMPSHSNAIPIRSAAPRRCASPSRCCSMPLHRGARSRLALPLQRIRRPSLRLCLAGQRESVANQRLSTQCLCASDRCYAFARQRHASPTPVLAKLRPRVSHCATPIRRSALPFANQRQSEPSLCLHWLINAIPSLCTASLSRSCSAPRCAMPLLRIADRFRAYLSLSVSVCRYAVALAHRRYAAAALR